MEGDLAAPVDVDDLGATGVERSLVRLGSFAGGEHRRVLEQEHGVGPFPGHDLGVDLTLELPGGQVVERLITQSDDALVHTHTPSLPPSGAGLWIAADAHMLAAARWADAP